jgi:hypothetical protein
MSFPVVLAEASRRSCPHLETMLLQHWVNWGIKLQAAIRLGQWSHEESA